MRHLIKSIRYLLTLVHNDGTETIKSFETIDNAMNTIAYLTGIQLLNYMPVEIKGDVNGNAYYWNWGVIDQWKITLEKVECNDGRQRRAVENAIKAGREKGKYRKGQTIDFTSCVETTLRIINDDVVLLASIEHTSTVTAIFESSIVFVDDNGNQYEYDGVCLNEGKLKVSIKPIFNTRIKTKKYTDAYGHEHEIEDNSAG